MTARRSNTANVFETTLSVAMAPTDLTATVATTTGGPASPCYMVLEPDKPTTQMEIVYFDGTFGGTSFVTSGIGNRYLTGSAAASGLTHPIGSKVRCVPTAQLITDLFDYIETMQAKALLTTGGDMPFATAAGVWARLAKGTAYQRIRMNAAATAPEWASLGSGANVDTAQTTASASFTDLATPGPAVTVNTNTSVLVMVSYFGGTSSGAGVGLMGVAVSGATTIAAATTEAAASSVGGGVNTSAIFLITGLTPGSNTFTAKYEATGASTQSFQNRNLIVIPL